MLRKFAVIAILLLAILMVYSFLPKATQPLTEQQAKAFLAEDLSPLNADWRILNSKQSGSSWEFEVLVTQAPHSTCPLSEKRFYTLPPVSYRPEPFISSCDRRDGRLLFREEALINSAQMLGIQSGYGCAFKANADWFAEKAYCPEMDANALASFADGLPADAWVVLWLSGGNTRLVAIDEKSHLIRTG